MEVEAKVDVKMNVTIERYWTLRGIRRTHNNSYINGYEVVAEKDFDVIPLPKDIAQFLVENKNCDFASVVQNNRLKEIENE